MKKAAIILDETLPTGLLANAAVCIVTGLFHGEDDVLGPRIDGSDCTFIPITKIGIPILKRGSRTFLELFERAKNAGVKYMLFTKEGQTTTSYEAYAERVTGKSASEVTIIGLGVIGTPEQVKSVAGDCPLLR
jgi:hypothetical protein